MKLKDIEGLDEASVYVEVGGELLSIGSSYQKIKGTTAQVVLVPSKPRAARGKRELIQVVSQEHSYNTEEVTGGSEPTTASN